MKVTFCSLLLITLLILGGFTASNTAAETSSTTTNTEWCTVNLDNPRSNLNVRNANGRVVSKLKHGASVYVDEYDGGFARVSVKRRGRLVILGWVASEYLYCGD